VSPSARQLGDRVASVRDRLRRRALLALVPWLLTGIACFLILAWISAGNEGWRPGSNIPALVDTLIVAWVVLGLVGVWRGARHWFGEVPLSRSIERAAGLQAGTVRGSLELSRSLPGGVSDSLAARAVASTAGDLATREADDLTGDLGRSVVSWTRRGLIAASISVVALVVLGVSTPERARHVWAGVSSPLSTMADPVLPRVVVTPGSIEVLRGADVPVRIEAQGREEVALAWQAAGDVARSQLLPVDQGRATHVFEDVSARIEYRVELPDGSGTETYTIVPIDPLFVSELVIDVTYPPHTGIPPDQFRGDAPPLRLPVGSVVDFEGAASRPLSAVELVDSAGSAALSMDVDGNDFSATWAPAVEGLFDWSFRDLAGAAAELQPEPLEIDLVPDSFPTVEILLPGQDTILPLSLQQPLVIDARDDYGLSRVELVAYRVTSFGDRHEPVVQGLDLAGTRGALARPILDVTDWELLPGDTVHYFARSTDNNPSPQTSTSREYVLVMPAAVELDRDAQAEIEEAADQLEELQAQAARLAEQNQNRALESQNQPNAQSGQGDDPDFRQREELRRAVEEQAAMLDNVDSLAARLDAMERRMEEAGQADPELAADLQELQDLLQELQADDELRERMADLSQSLSSQSQDQANQSLSDLAQQQEQFQEELGDALDSFRRAAVEQDFRATRSEVEELARLERALSDALREADDPGLRADQQSQLAERAEAVDERMEQLQERLSQLNEQAAAAQVEEARQAAADSREQMQQAEQQARQGDSQSAGDQADQAASQMDQAASQLEQAQEGMAQQTQDAAQAALNQAADDALSLARRQSDLLQQMANATPQELSDMRGDMASLVRGLQNVAENLQAGTEATGGTPQLSAQVGRALESMEATIQTLENSRSSASARSERAEEAIGNLNQVAMMAMATASQQGNPSGSGQSGQDMVKQMGQLAQRQGELLSQTGELMPMRLGQEAMQQQLGNLSQQQQSVAEQLGGMANDPGSDAMLGDLNEFADDAEELARQLAQGRLTPEIVRDQEQLFHRLLDAGRSLEQEETTEERESEAATAFERGDVVPLSELQLGAMTYELPDGDQLRRLSPALRQLVLEYFDRLNRGGSPPPAGGTR
jgi:hypothetical protein